MPKTGVPLTLIVMPYHRASLEDIALSLDCKRGKRGNISQLVQQIADKNLLVSRPEVPFSQVDDEHYSYLLLQLKDILEALQSLQPLVVPF